MEWAVSTKSVLRRANDPSWQFCAIESAERWLRKRFATDLSLGSAASCLTAELRISQPSSVRVLGARDDRRLGKVVRVGFPDESNAGERVCQLPANLLLHASPCLSASRRSSKQLLHIYSCRGCRDPTRSRYFGARCFRRPVVKSRDGISLNGISLNPAPYVLPFASRNGRNLMYINYRRWPMFAEPASPNANQGGARALLV